MGGTDLTQYPTPMIITTSVVFTQVSILLKSLSASHSKEDEYKSKCIMTEKEDDTFFYYNETQHDKPKLEKYVT
jgi:hypothetical protein